MNAPEPPTITLIKKQPQSYVLSAYNDVPYEDDASTA